MSCLNATFTLTPMTPFYYSANNNWAYLFCYGADFWPSQPTDLPSADANNTFFFDAAFASDPNLDYRTWANLKKARYLYPIINLQSYAAANKQLVLIFGFDVMYPANMGYPDSRVLVYTPAGLLPGGDQTLVYGDNQFVLEIDSLDQMIWLSFIHAGGYWSFRGLSGYVV